MKKILLSFLIFTTFGLQACPNPPEHPKPKDTILSGECPEKPEKLSAKNVQQVELKSQITKESGIVSQTKSIGYAFDAQKGQKLTYKTNESVCVWVYTPDNELLNNAVLPKAGKYTIQISAPKGSTTVELAMGLDVSDSSNNTDNSSDSNSSNLNPNSNSSPSSPITQDEAVNVVKNWQQTKRRLFASPFDRNLGSEILTGKAYGINVSNSDSSMNWLQKYNAYYTYGLQQVDSIKNFIASGNQATIEVVTTEERTLCKNSRIDREKTVSDTSRVLYNLQFEQGKWKISAYDTLEQIQKFPNPRPSC
ncbi:hypothetical protein DSM106972_092870 [Dulcicalothrix desertica PCC 7102]|uniref:Plastid division protein CDP1-like IMS domain-containing protein n=1 Tax=Dulcicalothrix desertica PCC 7102 TaxID=232991 RepID=A0A3S5K2Y7_9CYAN|nr:ARC6/PARC6 family protein [Dulcicalothrix desertica]RUS94650.1 hypothetical protein DSM106972_092870 [Dulcicalothrix desertica PCC 7102]TWH62544.1 uncharacterized protein DUF4101 [Dulcicalothrix desertica PCC 7102]